MPALRTPKSRRKSPTVEAKRPARASASADSPEGLQQALQRSFTITPKTARMLLAVGFNEYHNLRHASPNHIIKQFASLPGMTQREAGYYRAALRRLVYVATLAHPAIYPKTCTEWSRKGLVARGAWRDGYDDLTGEHAKAILEKGSEESR